MDITNHGGQRMNQRGITKEMIELTIQYGETQGEVTTLSRDRGEMSNRTETYAKELISRFEYWARLL